MKKYVTMSSLGSNGRTGNIIFQLNLLLYISDKYDYQILLTSEQNQMIKNFCLLDFELIKNTRFIDYQEKEEFGDLKLDQFLENNQLNLNINGYFQNFKYLDHKYLKTMFNFEKYNNLKEKLLNNKSILVGIHIRLGDYITTYKEIFNSVVNWSMDPNIIIKNIMNIFKGKFTNVKFLVFSDDIELCQKKLNIEEIEYNVLKNDSYTDLFMLSKCDHFILTNSTFGYWSYLLNIINNNVKNTYCFFPNKFFLNESRHGKFNDKIIKSYFRKNMNVFLYSTNSLDINHVSKVIF